MSRKIEAKFEWAVLRHLDAGHNLARWMLKNDQDAEDVIQDSALRALEAIKTFRGSDDKAWFLAIVRNTCLNRVRQRNSGRTVDFDVEDLVTEDAISPEALVIRAWEGETVRAAIENLSMSYREIVVLRELEGMSYRQIADVTGHPIGTVMSKLNRARARLQSSLQTLCDSELK